MLQKKQRNFGCLAIHTYKSARKSLPLKVREQDMRKRSGSLFFGHFILKTFVFCKFSCHVSLQTISRLWRREPRLPDFSLNCSVMLRLNWPEKFSNEQIVWGNLDIVVWASAIDFWHCFPLLDICFSPISSVSGWYNAINHPKHSD